MIKQLNCVAKTFYGLENILAEELSALKCTNIRILNRAVSFETDKAGLYRANLRSRFALSILVEWANFWTRNEEDFYKRMKRINWDDVLSPEKTFMISTTIPKSNVFTHSQYIGLKAKDAIADYFMDKHGKRPNVDTQNPDVKVNVYINGNKCTVSLDSSGEPLFKRGYRLQTGRAPLNEVLAAGLVKLSGWQANVPLLDPMCGSGTILIEAAMIAHNIPPGMKRRFGFQNWINYTPSLWDFIFKEETEKVTDSTVEIIGSDQSAEMLDIARENITSAFLEDSIKLKKQDFFKSSWTDDQKPLLIFNPPYNNRLKEDDVQDFYKQIGDTLKFGYSGAEAWIISSELEAIKFVGLRPSKKIKLYNGALECRFNEYKLYKGSKSEQIAQTKNP